MGTGPNMTYYPSSVEEVIGVDTNEYMARRLCCPSPLQSLPSLGLGLARLAARPYRPL